VSHPPINPPGASTTSLALSPPTTVHNWQNVYLRPGEKTDTWIAVEPQHSNYEIDQAVEAKKIGQLYFQMTRWTDSGKPKPRRVRKKL